MLEIHIKAAGIIFLCLASMHIFFPRYFNWQKELANMSLINRQMMYVHCFFIGLMLLLTGLFCLFYSSELVATPLGKVFSSGFAIFWMARLFIQFFGYSRQLWAGKKKETAIHILFILLWAYISLVFITNSSFFN